MLESKLSLSMSHPYDSFMTNPCISSFGKLAAVFLSLLISLPGLAGSPRHSDILLDIVTHCVDTRSANYCQQCRAPTFASVCTAEKTCQQTTDVWAMNEEFVAIRDIKMCGCPADFVHGLVLPRQVITGVEDPRRPQAIWDYAWQVGLTRMEPSSIALVINPQNFRSQNQMHIHVLRFKPQASQALSQLQTVEITDLNDVWRAATALAKAQSLPDYGVLVRLAPSGGFWVVVTPYSPGRLFTHYVCD
jgi:CDP-diacylglycerol pyrophosphatase